MDPGLGRLLASSFPNVSIRKWPAISKKEWKQRDKIALNCKGEARSTVVGSRPFIESLVPSFLFSIHLSDQTFVMRSSRSAN